MGIKEMLFIRAMQREYQKRFGHKLIVDFEATKQIVRPAEENRGSCAWRTLQRVCEEHNVEVNEFINSLHCAKTSVGKIECTHKYYGLLQEFSRELLSNKKASVSEAGRILKIDRSNFYYYAKNTPKEAIQKGPTESPAKKAVIAKRQSLL